MGGAPPPPPGRCTAGPKKPEKFGPLEGRIWPGCGAEDHAQTGGEGGPTTALIRGQREAEGDSPTPWAAVPAPSYPARSNPEGWGVGPRPSTREVEASDAASASRGHSTPQGSVR